METQNDPIQYAAALLRQATNIVAMTGAGISTPSGIPDFRSPDSGLWDQTDPMTVASIFAFRQHPEQFYRWIHPLAHRFFEAKPNSAHYALADLENGGKIRAVITQNIDDLHTLAGSKTVYQLHGHLRDMTCIECYRITESAEVFQKFVEDAKVPRCDCGGVLKPNVILFGEQLPIREYLSAEQAVKAADLMLVAGSSLEVAPASELPLLALANGAKLIIINHQPTHLDDRADAVIRADVAEVLPQLAELVTV